MLSLKESANVNDLYYLLIHLWTQKYGNIPWSVNLFKILHYAFSIRYKCAA